MMAGNGGDGSRSNGGASISATAVGSGETRFRPPHHRRHRWGGCWVRLSCFGSQKRTKRIVPSSRAPDINSTANHAHGPQPVGISNQTSMITPSLLAPPSSPASFTHSALPSTAQSPNFFPPVCPNSPGGPSSTMFVTGPYAYETQLVSPPVFSTFTTEPSTAPLTPPPELSHLRSPSSPDVPYAHYLSSSLHLKSVGKENDLAFVSTVYNAAGDLGVTYPYYPESPASSLISPMSVTPRTGLSSPVPEREIGIQWNAFASAGNSPYSRYRSWALFGVNPSTSKDHLLSSDSGFFPPASAQFHLDQAQQSHASYSPCDGRLSFSREGNRQNKCCKQDVEEVEAYRASFGFSADELINTPSYVEISDASDISFPVPTFLKNNKSSEKHPGTEILGRRETDTIQSSLLDRQSSRTSSWADLKLPFLSRETPKLNGNHHALTDEILSLKKRDMRCKSFRAGLSSSDAEIDYRRSRSSKNASILF